MKTSHSIDFSALRKSPLLYWAFNTLSQEFHISDKLVEVLAIQPELKVFLASLNASDQKLVQTIMNKAEVPEKISLSHQYNGTKVQLTYSFQKNDDYLIAWGEQSTENNPLGNKLLHNNTNKLVHNSKLLEALQGLQSKIWLGDDTRQAFDLLLEDLLNITESGYGFIGYVLYNKEQAPYLKTHAITNISWNKETRDFYKKQVLKGLEFRNLDTLFGYVMRHNEIVISNNPAEDKRRGGLPKGHPPLNAFLGIPLNFQGQLVGMVGLANRENGYNEKLVELLQPFLVTYGSLIKNLELHETQINQREELLLAKSQVEHAHKVQSRILKNISHELRTPLSLILGPITELLQKPKEEFEQINVQGKLQSAKTEIDKLVDLVNSILDLSSKNLLEEIEEAVPLFLFMKDLFNAFSEDTKQKNQSYQFTFLADKKMIAYFDRHKVENIISAFISNAIKFTPEYGVITINTKIFEETVHIEVRDTGIGIPKQQLQNIFNINHQVEEGGLSAPTGLGMGLTIAKELADTISANIEVISKYGMGSSFILSFPLKKELENKPKVEEHLPVSNNQEQVLVVEDSESMGKFIESILLPHFNVQVVDNGKKALDLLKQEKTKFDLIISDLMMPVMNGIDLLKIIRTDEVLQNIPIIILSALSEEKTKLEIISIGIDDYVSKPFISDELLASIKNCLQNLNSRQSFNDEIQNNEGDLSWLKLLRQSILEDIDNQQLTIGTLAQKLYVSERQLYREIQRITGMTPLKYLKEVRLQHARILFETEKVTTISEVSYACGFGTVAYFSRLYERRFGRKPSSYFS